MDHWKNDILRSLEGARRAEPDTQVYTGIRARITAAGQLQVVRRPYLAVAAACLTILITANMYALAQPSPEAAPSPSAYQVDQANFNLY